MGEYVARLSGSSPLPKGHHVVKLLAVEKEQVGPGTNFIYVYVVVVESGPDSDG